MAIVNHELCLFLLVLLPLSLVSAIDSTRGTQFDYAIVRYYLGISGQVSLIALLVLVSGLYAGMFFVT
jgi:hypothetical protein